MELNVVIVDNAPELLERLSGIMEHIPQVQLRASFEEAVAVVDYVKNNSIDMVFTDVVMPDISGISLAAELHKLPDPPAVVLMSSIPGFSLEAWKIQAYSFIEKPYTRLQVQKVIDQYAREKKELLGE